MDTSQIFGYIGCVLLVSTLLPQIYKNYKSKTMNDVSFIFIILQNLTCVAFLTYGCLLLEQPLIIANGIVQLQCLTLLGMKLKYDGNPFKSIEIKETEEIVIVNNVPIKITTIWNKFVLNL